MDTVDIFYLHKWDGETSLEETVETLAELREAGLVRYIGVSNYSAWQTMKAACIAQNLGIRIDILQPMYNLVKRQAEVEILPMAISEGFNVAPYSPLGGGLLTGKYASGGAGRFLTRCRMIFISASQNFPSNRHQPQIVWKKLRKPRVTAGLIS